MPGGSYVSAHPAPATRRGGSAALSKQKGERSVPETWVRGTTAALPNIADAGLVPRTEEKESRENGRPNCSFRDTRSGNMPDATPLPATQGILKGSDPPADSLRASMWSVRSKTAALSKKRMLNRPSRNVAQGGMRPSVFRVETAAAPHANRRRTRNSILCTAGATPRNGVSRSSMKER